MSFLFSPSFWAAGTCGGSWDEEEMANDALPEEFPDAYDEATVCLNDDDLYTVTACGFGSAPSQENKPSEIQPMEYVIASDDDEQAPSSAAVPRYVEPLDRRMRIQALRDVTNEVWSHSSAEEKSAFTGNKVKKIIFEHTVDLDDDLDDDNDNVIVVLHGRTYVAPTAAQQAQHQPKAKDYTTATRTRESFESPLHAWLISHGLGRHYHAITRLGAKRISDLGYITKKDMDDLGLADDERRQLQIKVAK